MSVQTDDITPLPKGSPKSTRTQDVDVRKSLTANNERETFLERRASPGPETERVVDTRVSSVTEEAIERALRPRTLEDYVGQVKVREQLSIFIQAAKQRGESLDHVLLFGPPGLGKTTLSQIIAHELGVNLRQTSGPVLEKPKDLAALLTGLEKNDVLFIDEIHRLSPVEKPFVIMVAGVNGAGKTTSIGKLTRHLSDAGASVLLAAADTFRAAAKEQLESWATKTEVEIISQAQGDPAAVSFDAVSAAKSRGRDVVLIDTAGRLPTQLHLMQELQKIKRVIQKAQASAPHETLLVIDGNTGQNALAQVKAFDEALDLTGLIVTKLDGTAKGGAIAAIALWGLERALTKGRPLPVYFVGVGEKLEDLQVFKAQEFCDALLN